MKILRISAVAILALLFTSAAFGNSLTDPKVIVHGVSGGMDGSCPQCRKVGLKFSFTSPKVGEGGLFFTNASGKNWTSLKLVEMGVPAADVSCGTSLFLSCKVMTLKNGAVEILLSGIRGGDNQDKGILAGQSFVIGFSCTQGHCWPKGGITFNATAGTGSNVVPEPATLALTATGIAALFSRRKYLKKS